MIRRSLYYMNIKLGLLIFLVGIAAAQVVSRPIQTTYTEFGGFESFQISWKPLEDVCSTCYIQVAFPEVIHSNALPLTFSLLDENGVPYVQDSASVAPTSATYYFNANQLLPAGVWYIIIIYPTKSPSMAYGLVGLSIVSGIVASNIIYESNTALEYYHRESITLPTSNLVITPISAGNTLASQIYPFRVSFSSSIASTQATLITFTLTNQNYSTLTVSTSLIQNNNFNFIGSCQIICSNTSCINPLSCLVRNNQLQLTLPYLLATTYTFQFTILNPNFVDTTGIAAQIKNQIGIISGIGITNNVFTVNPISIIANGVNLHWGIPLSIVQNTMGLGIFVDGGWNTMDVGFTISQTTMIGSQFKVFLYVGSSSVLQQSINTNLPSLNRTSNLVCNYQLPYIICSPVDAFTSKSLRYYIKFKAYFASTDNYASFGSMKIALLNSNNILFNDLTQTLAIPPITWSNYRDSGGFHSSSYKIKETQVIGTADSGLTNSTSTFMNGLFSSNSSFIGIDPQVSNQQLIFLLKTLPSQMSSGIINQTYEMKVYINPNVFLSIGTQGLDIAAYDVNSNSFREDAASCYINSSTSPTIQIYQCQAYKDYVYGSQIDNTYASSNYFGAYSFICGNGRISVCPFASCAQSCRLFKGMSLANGYSGVFSIRNVAFLPGFQTTSLANQMTLDFIVAFYQGGALVSASLLNAYTVKQSRLSQMRLNFYNTYLSAAKTNDGARVPNLLSLNGHLSINELKGINYDEFALFLPQEVTVNKYVETGGRVGCTHVCASSKIYNTLTLCQDNWICKQKVSIKGIQNIDSSIDFKVPIEITNTIMGSFDLALIRSSVIIKIYRFNGSAIADPLSPSPIPLISVGTFSNPWASSNYWVKTSTDIYNEGLNLNSIVQFSSSNSIDMLGSNLTYSGAPFITFTSIYTSIFSSYSTILANNQLVCNSPFKYNYNSLYDVTVLLCPLLSNSLNQVVINYPLYSGSMGANFPFQTIFAYAFSDGLGNLVAFRTESNSKSSKDVCTTAILSNYNYGDVAQQRILFSLSFTPITLDANKYPTMQISVTVPTQIPVAFLACLATETLINQIVTCSVVSSSSNSGILQLSSLTLVTITSLQIGVWVSLSGAVTASAFNTYYYTINVQLPQTDASANPSVYGSAYSPFASVASSCSNILNLVNVGSTNQLITISSITSNGVALNYYSDISFNAKFSTSRTDILSSSDIDITFVNAVTSPITSCSLWTPQNYIFIQQTVLGNGVKLKPLAYDAPFTFSSYNITCRNLIVTQNSVTIKVAWIDGANVLQQSVNTPYLLNLATSSTITGSLISKNFNTIGFDAQYVLTLVLPTNANDDVDIWLHLDDSQIHEMFLECFYLSNGLSQQIYCANDWQGKIHLTFTAAAASNIQFSIYGIHQNGVNANYKLLVGINKLQYYVATVTDSIPPNTLISQPIIIKSELLQSNFCLELALSFPVAFGSTIYIQLDDSFRLPRPQILYCSIDGANYTCTRVAPNVISIVSSFSFAANTDHTLQICQLLLTRSDVLDPSLFHFKAFTMSGTNINMGSHEHLSTAYAITSMPVFTSTLLTWSQFNFNVSWVYHEIYIGYYGNPVFLTTYNQTTFAQNFVLSSASNNSYINVTNNVLLGTAASSVDLAYIGTNVGNWIDYLLVSHLSQLYGQPPYLPLFISDKKCTVSTQYTLYETYPSGITLPIMLDFSSCRPAVDHLFSYSINSPELLIDSSLSNSKINSTFPQVFVFVRQIPTNTLLNGIFTMTIQFSGPFDTSFIVSPSVSIKINPGTILQIPQSVPPVINFQNNSMVNLTLQCNQPSTIYWALGLYPTILGITYEMIQTQLINGQQGIRNRVFDPYSWSEELYGLDYQYYANKNKTLVITSLQGGRSYIFKYFCVNQLGTASGGQITNFTTASTSYGISKVQLQFANQLSIQSANHIACYIAEVLLTPYSTVITSTFSNCINNSLTYYPTPNSTYFDQSQGGLYNYYFYIDSQTVSTADIRSILPVTLHNYSSYLSTIAPHSSISIIPLMNNYDPIVKSHSFNGSLNGVTCVVDVGVVRSYLVLAYINKTFDPMVMTIPPHHLIKQGNFSSVSQFNQVYMKYGSNNISINLTGLQQYSNYSIFYFVTVDNPALNSKPTPIYYENIQTSVYVAYDLSSASLLYAFLGAIFMIALF